MTDMTKTIQAKSDQLNADDILGRSITIKITKISLLAGEQPVAISYEGDDGKPWKPCKTVRRILVNVWGGDGSKYIGRSLTIFRDDGVTYGGMAVGGIRISHMSDIDKPVSMALSATKKSKKIYTVEPLKTVTAPTAEKPTATKPSAKSSDAWIDWGKGFAVRLDAAMTHADIEDMAEEAADALTKMQNESPKVYERIMVRIKERRAELAQDDDLPDFAK